MQQETARIYIARDKQQRRKEMKEIRPGQEHVYAFFAPAAVIPFTPVSTT